jgi:hypothetical protein
VDTAKINAIEGELDSFVAGRDKERWRGEGERPAEEIWQESMRTYNAKRQVALAWEWLRYHVRRRRARKHTFALLDAHDEAEIRRYEEMLGINYEREESA